MIYEGRWAPKFHWTIAIAVLLLSVLGSAATGVIPTASGANPLIGLPIVVACFAAAFVFIRRATSDEVLARADDIGLYVKAVAPQPIPWSEIRGARNYRMGNQWITRVKLRDPAAIPGARLTSITSKVDSALSYGHFGINTTYYDRGRGDLLAAIRSRVPDEA